MTIKKLLIAQRLDEVARELESIATLADEFNAEIRWAGHVSELRNAAELGRWWAKEIRADQEQST